MKEIKLTGPLQGPKISPLTSTGCGCAAPAPGGVRAPGDTKIMEQDFLTGAFSFRDRSFPQVDSIWTGKDHLGHIRSRLGAFRMSYTVEPGLYALGSPDQDSPVMVSCNYKLSFDILRRELKGLDAWILVLDTKGINVWCAAGKGTFGTAELVLRIQSAGLEAVVDHKKIILPQLGAPGIRSAEVQRRTGFRVYFGPVRAGDIPAYLDSNLKATEPMRRVNFPLKDRLVLTPMEVVPVMKPLAIFSLAILAFSGLQAQGLLFRDMASRGLPLVLLAVCAVLAGAVLTPALLPVIPFRSLAIKGWITGALVTGTMYFTGVIPAENTILTAAVCLFFPVVASYLALQFTGATTYTGISGVKKELRFALPLYKGAAVISAVLLLGDKLVQWGIL